MKKTLSRIAALVLYGSFAASSGAFAAMPEQEAAANQTFQCTVTWKADSDVCKNRKDAAGGKCTEKYQGDHASEAEAKERCEHIYGLHLNSGVESCDPCWTVTANQTPEERCRLACDVINRKCIARCRPRNNKECMNRCNQDTAACYKDCKKQ